MKIQDQVAVITGAASGIGYAVCEELINKKVKAIAAVDMSESVREAAERLNQSSEHTTVTPYIGDTTNDKFRINVYDSISAEYGRVGICVPAAGIIRDELAVKYDRETGETSLYPIDTFKQVVDVNLIAPAYWVMEMIARITKDRASKGLKRWTPDEEVQGAAVFIGSISSQGNTGQVSYASTKAGLIGVAATLAKEGVFSGVRCTIVHPGLTDTPMARSLPERFIDGHISRTQIKRLIKPSEVASAICFMLENSAISDEVWVDGGWFGNPT